LQVISELLSYKTLLEATDLARWSPLHIAAFMGRREAVARLLRAGASPFATNLNRQAPTDLSPDFGTLAAFKEGTGELEPDEMLEDATQVAGCWSSGIDEDNISAPLEECEHIPFFLPPVPAIRCHDRRDELWNIGVLIFNTQPSYGLAFTVSAGLATNYADALLKILRSGNVNRAQVGGFLGEALSLSSLTRLSLFDSIALYNTGVVTALRAVFSVFQLPEDFQKINRLLSGVAHVWWRKNKEALDDFATKNQAIKRELEKLTVPETSGLELRSCLSSLDALAQLMFSTVMSTI